MQHSVRRQAKLPTQAWLDAFAKERSAEAADCLCLEKFEEGLIKQATAVMFERRAKVQGKLPEQSYLTRKVMKEEDYYSTAYAAGSTPGITKFVLRFLDAGHYYELFFYSNHKDLVLDFSDGAPKPPGWLELTGTKDLTRESSGAWVTGSCPKRVTD